MEKGNPGGIFQRGSRRLSKSAGKDLGNHSETDNRASFPGTQQCLYHSGSSAEAWNCQQRVQEDPVCGSGQDLWYSGTVKSDEQRNGILDGRCISSGASGRNHQCEAGSEKKIQKTQCGIIGRTGPWDVLCREVIRLWICLDCPGKRKDFALAWYREVTAF